MAGKEGIGKLKNYFCGFSKFFNLSNDKEPSDFTETGLTNECAKDNLSFFSPTEIYCAAKIGIICANWSTVFHLHKDSGKVHVYGWCNGRAITVNENAFLPIDGKVCNLQTGWKTLVVISDDGRCHVIPDLHNDWTATVYQNVTKFTKCDVGDLHTIVLDESGKVYELKNDNKIQNSKLDMNNKTVKSISSSCLFSPIKLTVKIDEVSCGKEHVLLLNKMSGHVLSFGLGSRGQLGHGRVDPETTPQIVEALAGICIKEIAAGGWHSLALSDTGDVYAWGWNNQGQLGITCLPPEIPQAFYMLPYIVEFPQECMVDHIACGARHSAAVTSNPKWVWTWGWGQYGQLGHNNTLDKTTPTVVKYFETVDGEILDIVCGPWQTIVTLEEDSCDATTCD